MKVRYYRDAETAGSESRYFQSFVVDLFGRPLAHITAAGHLKGLEG